MHIHLYTQCCYLWIWIHHILDGETSTLESIMHTHFHSRIGEILEENVKVNLCTGFLPSVKVYKISDS